MGPITDVLDDEERRGVALEIDAFLKLESEPDPPVGGHPDFFAEFPDRRGLRIFVLAPSTSGQSPASCVAELDENELAVRGESDGMCAIGARLANVPARHQQLVHSGEDETKRTVEQGHIRYLASAQEWFQSSSCHAKSWPKGP